MRPSLWFVVPAAGRTELTAICLQQLSTTCSTLVENGIQATAVVIADDKNLRTAQRHGFGWVKRNNEFTSRKYNDGIQLALDPAYNPRPADYVVPLGSDDWVDWRLFLELPPPDTMVGFQKMAFVREDGRELTVMELRNEGGCGIRIYPRAMMIPMGYRPADESRRRGCDTSILVNLKRAKALKWVEHRDLDPLQIVDWKTHGGNLNPYAEVAARHRADSPRDPYTALQGRFSPPALEAMAAHYGAVPVAA